MKRITILLIIIAIVVVPISTAFATNAQLEIDNSNVYDGMSKSYSQGYKPSISNGKAVIILPLIYEGTEPITGNEITAVLNLGTTDNSPFSYANYQMSVTLADNTVGNGTSTVSSYLVRFDIPLASKRYIGTYPVIINTSFSTATESNVTQSFTVYVNITDGIDPSVTPAPPEEPKEPAPRPQPKIIVSEYTVNPSVVIAGEDFDVNITLLNTEDYWHTKNIVVTYTGETADIMPNDKKNSFFIEEIKDEEAYDLTLHVTSRLDAEPRPQKVIINITYEDSARASYSVTEEILIQIKQPIRLELDEINLPKTVNAGDSIPLTMNVFNMGKSTLYNVLCTLEMQGAIPDGSAYLGNMESGTSGTAEIYVFFGTLNMNSSNSSNEESERYGMSTGTMTISYEDEYGEIYTEMVEVSTNIERPVFDDVFKQEEPVEEQERASQWWVSIALLVGVGMVLYGIISYRRKVNKLKREYGNEDI